MTDWILLDPEEHWSPKLRKILAQLRAEIDALKTAKHMVMPEEQQDAEIAPLRDLERAVRGYLAEAHGWGAKEVVDALFALDKARWER